MSGLKSWRKSWKFVIKCSRCRQECQTCHLMMWIGREQQRRIQKLRILEQNVLVAVVVVHAVCSSSLSCFRFCASQQKKMRFIAGEHLFVCLFFFFHLILFYKREEKKRNVAMLFFAHRLWSTSITLLSSWFSSLFFIFFYFVVL